MTLDTDTTYDDAVREYRELRASFAFAYAFGHGCSIGDHPQHRAVRQRVADLRALIAEHEVET